MWDTQLEVYFFLYLPKIATCFCGAERSHQNPQYNYRNNYNLSASERRYRLHKIYSGPKQYCHHGTAFESITNLHCHELKGQHSPHWPRILLRWKSRALRAWWRCACAFPFPAFHYKKPWQLLFSRTHAQRFQCASLPLLDIKLSGCYAIFDEDKNNNMHEKVSAGILLSNVLQIEWLKNEIHQCSIEGAYPIQVPSKWKGMFFACTEPHTILLSKLRLLQLPYYLPPR